MAGELKKTFTTLYGDIEAIRAMSISFYGDWGQSINIPISVIEGGEDLKEGPNQDLNVETWWCKNEGLD